MYICVGIVAILSLWQKGGILILLSAPYDKRLNLKKNTKSLQLN
jgi:hypothetical protein